MNIVTEGNPISKITIRGSKPSIFVISILSLFLLIGLIIPILVTFLNHQNSERFSYGIVISAILFWGVSYYLFKLLSWNFNGYEEFSFINDKIEYRAKTKFINLKKFNLNRNTAQFSILKTEMVKNNETLGNLVIFDGKNEVKSNIKIPLNDLDNLISKLLS